MSILCVKPLITCIASFQVGYIVYLLKRGVVTRFITLVVFLAGGEKGSGVHVYTLHSKYMFVLCEPISS